MKRTRLILWLTQPVAVLLMKWAGLVSCLLLVAVIALTLRYWVGFRVGSLFCSLIPARAICLTLPEDRSSRPLWEFTVRRQRQIQGLADYPVWYPTLHSSGFIGNRMLCLPLWIPLLGIAIPTIWLWRRDRRRDLSSCS